VITLVTGPVRSGKSAFALRLATAAAAEGGIPLYVATADVDPGDPDMVARVERHRRERGAMRSIETNERAGPTLAETLLAAPAGEVLIVDSLGTWLAAGLLALDETRGAVALATDLERATAPLLPALAAMRADVVVVAEETGWGVVPPTVLGRVFRDVLGRLTATLAARADRAFLVVAGYAIDLRAAGRPISDW